MSSTAASKSKRNSAADPKRPPVVHVRFASCAGRRLRRPGPTSCPGEAPFWTERPILLKRANGSYELIGTADNLKGLARWILSFGADAEVRGPERLERKVATKARRVWKQYAGE